MNEIKDMSASVRQRLKNYAHQQQRPFNEVVQYYAMERFLFRFSKSTYVDNFILKGALMLSAWQSPQNRPTMDIDFLGMISNSKENIQNIMIDIMSIEFDDGITFDPSSTKLDKIKEDAEYEGWRVSFKANLNTMKINMQLDIGFGDQVYPAPEYQHLPTLLNSPEPKIRCYSKESAIAEKFEAMIKLDNLNSRMKDFFDVWLLSKQFKFDSNKLSKAIQLTIATRQTAIPNVVTAFSSEFAEEKQIQWDAFRRRLDLDYAPASFSVVVEEIHQFLKPVLGLIKTRVKNKATWIPGIGWSN